MVESRQHHIVPAFYLRGFAREGRLQAFDLETGRCLAMTPENAARQRDYYALDSPGVPKHLVEDQFIHPNETAAAPILRRFRNGDLDVSPEDMGHLIAFAALMYVRTDAIRKFLRARADDMARRRIALIAPDEETFKKRMAAIGADIAKLTYEDIRRAGAGESFHFDFHQNYHVKFMVDALPKVLDLFRQRKWSLFRPDAGVLGFVTSDQPVALYRTEDLGSEKALYKLPLTDKRTGILLPLAPRLLLVGDHDFGHEVRYIDQEEVARCNQGIAVPGGRFVYSSSRRVRWFDSETSEIRKLEDGLSSLAQRVNRE